MCGKNFCARVAWMEPPDADRLQEVAARDCSPMQSRGIARRRFRVPTLSSRAEDGSPESRDNALEFDSALRRSAAFLLCATAAPKIESCAHQLQIHYPPPLYKLLT